MRASHKSLFKGFDACGPPATHFLKDLILADLPQIIPQMVWSFRARRNSFHESLDNLTPKDVYLGQGEKIKKIREIIKQKSINKRIFDNKTMKYQSK